MTEPRGVTVMIHHDGDVSSRSFRFPQWAWRTLMTTGVVVGILAVVGVVLYAPIVKTAATVPGLKRRVADLEARTAQVAELSRSLSLAEQRYEQIRGMLGGDVVPALRSGEGPDPIPVAEPILAVVPGAAPRYEEGPSRPTHWPLVGQGVVTREQVDPGVRDETHAGLDVAVPLGTAIRASGGGVVAETGEDAEYGIFILIDHPEGFQSLYGHTSRLLAAVTDTVAAGQVIALSGTTGRSTGPHLHFEIRRGGRAVDPRTLVKEAR
jgi:murein DD-endopeptidase MepM/ murein hydrolase activator NlpD